MLEVIEDRAARRSTMVASQLPVDNWHAAMADPTLSEAILDRLYTTSHRIAMTGPSQRNANPTSTTKNDTRPPPNSAAPPPPQPARRLRRHNRD